MTVNELIEKLQALTEEQKGCDVYYMAFSDQHGLQPISQVDADGWTDAVALE